MMIFMTFSLIILLGFFLVDLISRETNLKLKFGLSYPVGMGVTSIYMFMLDVVGIKFTLLLINVLNFIIICIILFINRHYQINRIKSLKFNFTFRKINVRRINFVWGFLFLLLIIVISSNVNRNIYWPVYAYDSVAGFDLSAKAIAQEGKIAVSLFDYGLNLRRGVYPPLSSTAFSIPYMLRMSSSKVIMSFFFISLIMAFYGLLRRYVKSINAMFFTLLLAITPEMYGYGVLSNSNLPGVIFIGIGGLFFCNWMIERKQSDLIIAALLLGLNVWLRSDGVVFNLAASLILLIDSIKKRNFKSFLVFSIISFAPFILWSFYLRFKLGIVQDRFVNHPYFDLQRLHIMQLFLNKILISIDMYGVIPILFMISLILNWKQLKTSKSIYPIFIFLSLFLYLLVYYQLDDVKQDPISSMMRNSFRRGYLVFMPLYLFYISISQTSIKFFNIFELQRKHK